MSRMFSLYALLISVLSAFAFLSLAALSEAMIEHWQMVNPDQPRLGSFTLCAPIVNRYSMMLSGLLCCVALLSFKRGLIGDPVLMHGIAVMAVLQGLITIYTVMVGFLPAMVTITEMPVSGWATGRKGGNWI